MAMAPPIDPGMPLKNSKPPNPKFLQYWEALIHKDADPIAMVFPSCFIEEKLAGSFIKTPFTPSSATIIFEPAPIIWTLNCGEIFFKKYDKSSASF